MECKTFIDGGCVEIGCCRGAEAIDQLQVAMQPGIIGGLTIQDL
jgi:hypothetical protein